MPNDGTPPHIPSYIARWDLDKTYLRTEFGTLRDLVRTAFERPEKKRTVPGAAPLLREIAATGASIHIVSGSPESLRSRLEQKLRLDGARWDTFTLKPNLSNVLRLRLRAVREQIGYKLPALLASRARMEAEHDPRQEPLHEVLIGDDAESDALVYSIYADVLGGGVALDELEKILEAAHAYDDAIAAALSAARRISPGDVVDRILIHLDQRSPPSEFAPYGPRVVPFYNYLQAAFILEEMGLLPPAAVVRVAVTLAVNHGLDGRALGRSYLNLMRRGHVSGNGVPDIVEAYASLGQGATVPAAKELRMMCDCLLEATGSAPSKAPPSAAPSDYPRFAPSDRPNAMPGAAPAAPSDGTGPSGQQANIEGKRPDYLALARAMARR